MVNQILVTKRIYVTPELKRKKKLYKFDFFISVFLICILFSYYIYAEYDRNKSEKVSQEILSGIDLGELEVSSSNTTVKVEDDVLIVVLDENNEGSIEIKLAELIGDTQEVEKVVHTTESGKEYYTEAILKIDKINLNYPILSDSSEELLKISLNKFWGPNPNQEGNYCIVGHNYKNKKMFGRLSELEIGDTAELTDLKGNTITYEVYDIYIVDPTDKYCTKQETDGKKEITLITCTKDRNTKINNKST